MAYINPLKHTADSQTSKLTKKCTWKINDVKVKSLNDFLVVHLCNGH